MRNEFHGELEKKGSQQSEQEGETCEFMSCRLCEHKQTVVLILLVPTAAEFWLNPKIALVCYSIQPTAESIPETFPT